MQDQANLIIVSDHGMAETNTDRLIFLDEYVDEDDYHLIEKTPMLMLNGKEGNTETVYNQLLNAHPALHVYLAADYPAEWHWEGHRRIPEMVALADDGWTIISSRTDYLSGRETVSPGAHGYERMLASMQAIFIAKGPAFREGEVVGAFENIHVYPLVTDILGLKPAEIDGSLDKVRHVLKKTDN